LKMVFRYVITWITYACFVLFRIGIVSGVTMFLKLMTSILSGDRYCVYLMWALPMPFLPRLKGKSNAHTAGCKIG